MLMSMAAVMCVCIYACGSDDPEVPSPPEDPKENGEISFVVNLPTGSGSGTPSSPVVVEKGEDLDMAISQKSSYTDPDGTVFTCEPKATIKLSATLDTIVAKDLTELTKVKQGSDVKTNSTGKSPVVNQTLQTFEIGGQKIVFDLAHEVYTYLNSLNEQIEMPYVKVNQAKLGNTAASEETPAGRSAIAVTSVTVRPLAQSRATTVTDSTMYEVTARFNLDIESMNAKTDTKQTLDFAVTYVGVVETTTTLYDPVYELSYQWDLSGTNSTASPFVKNFGSAMEIIMNQKSAYTDEYSNKSTGNPKAKIKLSVAQDTVWTTSADKLQELAQKTGDVSGAQTATQIFSDNLQTITVEWSYESAEILPYYVLQPVTLKDVQTTEIGEKTVSGKDATLYEVTATFGQKAIAQPDKVKTSEVDVEYVVKYIVAIELKLVDVKYEPGGTWVDSHDNIVMSYFANVKRTRIYSNGKEAVDMFYDLGHSGSIGSSNISKTGTTYYGRDGKYPVTVYEGSIIEQTDSTSTYAFRCEVPCVREFTEITHYDDLKGVESFGDFSTYEKSGAATHPDLTEKFNNNYPDDSRESRWYVKGFYLENDVSLEWDGYFVTYMRSTFRFHDQHLVIDGKRIDFNELHKFSADRKVTYEDFTEIKNDGKIVKFTTTINYLGKQFIGTYIDSVYVVTPQL